MQGLEAQVRPVEVDLEAVQPDPGLGQRQARSSRDTQEEALELGVREPERAPVQELAQSANPGQRVAQRLGVDQIEPVGLVYCSFESGSADASRKVDERAGDVCHRDAISEGDVVREHTDSAVGVDAWPVPGQVQREGNVYETRLVRDDTPERSRALVAEHRRRTACEQRRHPRSLPAQVRTPDGVDAPPSPSMKPAVR
jgi:hypothetical protein